MIWIGVPSTWQILRRASRWYAGALGFGSLIMLHIAVGSRLGWNVHPTMSYGRAALLFAGGAAFWSLTDLVEFVHRRRWIKTASLVEKWWYELLPDLATPVLLYSPMAVHAVIHRETTAIELLSDIYRNEAALCRYPLAVCADIRDLPTKRGEVPSSLVEDLLLDYAARSKTTLPGLRENPGGGLLRTVRAPALRDAFATVARVLEEHLAERNDRFASADARKP